MPPRSLETAHLQAIFEIDRTEPQPRRRLYPGLSSLAVVSTDLGRGALRTDVAIIGGGLGACAAALAAARLGRTVILTEETHWLGGQLTNQAVPPDEHPWIEEFGATASYRALRQGIRDYYRAHLPLTAEARADATLNPGNGWVSRLCHDPRVAVAVLHQMMAPHQLSGRLFVMHPHRPISAWTHGDRVTGVVVRGLESGRDYADRGAVLHRRDAVRRPARRSPASSTCSGAESRAETGEPHAAEQADPRDQQAITVCFAMEHLPGEDHTIDRPRQYELWRELRPPGWPGRLLELDHGPARDARAADALAVRGGGRAPLVAVPPNPRPHELRGRLRPQRHHASSTGRRTTTGSGPSSASTPAERATQPRGGAAAQPQPALLAADRGASPGRRRRLSRAAPARRRRRRHAGRAGAGALRPGVAADARRVHRARAAHRASARGRTAPSCSPTRSASAATGSISIRGSAAPATSTSAAGRSRSRSAR